MPDQSKRRQTPGSVPRGCDATYRGYLTRDAPKRVAQPNNRSMVTCRIGVNMAAPSVPPENRSALTEWVNVIALRKAVMERLLRCEPRELIVVCGPVTLHTWETKSQETRIDRTIVADYVRSCGASIPPREEAAPAADAGDELPSGDGADAGELSQDDLDAAAAAAGADEPPA